jgi:hypothetical protein
VAAPNDIAAAQPCATAAVPDRVPRREGGIEERTGGARDGGARSASRPGDKERQWLPMAAAYRLRHWEKGLGIRVE